MTHGNGTQTTALATTSAISTQDYGLTRTDARPRVPDRFAFEPRDISELGTFSEMVIRSGLAPRSLKTPQAVALVCIQGRELGLSSCAALQGMTAINGQIGFRARLVSNLVKSSNVCKLWRVIETDEMIGRVEVQHVQWDEPQTVRYTVEDAKTAGLWGSSDPWRKHPKDMLIARAITRAVDRHFSEVLGGVPVETALEDKTAPAAAPPPPQAVTVAPPAAETKPEAPKPTQGMAGLKAALAQAEPEPEAEPEQENPTREAAADQWRGLHVRLVELVGESEAAKRCESITIEKKRSARGRQKALDQLSEIVAGIEAAGI